MAENVRDEAESADSGLASINIKFTSSDRAAGKVEISLDATISELKQSIR